MRILVLRRYILTLGLALVLAGGCTALSGKTAGENIDDASITTAVKTKLATEKFGTVTKIDVDTNKGTVYLTGNVETAVLKTRATELARQVQGVREVVNNLKLQTQ